MLSKGSLQMILELLNKVNLPVLDPHLTEKTMAFAALRQELEAAFKEILKKEKEAEEAGEKAPTPKKKNKKNA